MIERIGIDQRPLGADFEEATIAAAMGDAGGLQLLFDAFRRLGYDEEMTRKVTHENSLRVLERVWGTKHSGERYV